MGADDAHSEVPFQQTAFQLLFPRPVALHEVAVTQVQDPECDPAAPHTIGPKTLIQPV